LEKTKTYSGFHFLDDLRNENAETIFKDLWDVTLKKIGKSYITLPHRHKETNGPMFVMRAAHSLIHSYYLFGWMQCVRSLSVGVLRHCHSVGWR